MSLKVYGPGTAEAGQPATCTWVCKNDLLQPYGAFEYKIEFYLDGVWIKEVDVGTLVPGQTKEGTFTFTAPGNPGTHTLRGISFAYIGGRWLKEGEDAVAFTVLGGEEGLTPAPPEAEMPAPSKPQPGVLEPVTPEPGVPAVSVEDALMQELMKWYKKNVDVPVAESYDWSFDVTNTVINSGLVPGVKKAYLYGWYRINGYTYAGTERPPDRSDAEKVSGWLNGVEKALLYIGSDTYTLSSGDYGWYWADIPCKLYIEQEQVAPPKAEIVKDILQYPQLRGGVSVGQITYKPGATIEVDPGTVVEYNAMAKNVGGPGEIWIRVLANGVEIDRAEGDAPSVSGKVTINQDTTIRFEAGHGDTVDDTWGDWYVKLKAAPRARILKDLSSYPDGLGGVIYNGAPLPTGTAQVHKGDRVEYLATAVNEGGSGTIWIRVLVNGAEVDRAEGGTSATVHGYITVNQDITVKFEAGHGDTKDDEWGC